MQDGTFAPGQSGNPGGKRPGTRHKTTRAIEALLEGQHEALTQVAIDKALTGDTVEYAFEAIGRSDTSRQAFDIVEQGGTAVIVGMVADDITVPGPAFLSEKKLIGCMYGSTRFREHMPKLLELYRQGRLDLSALVTERMGLADINVALDKITKGEVARSVLEIGL